MLMSSALSSLTAAALLVSAQVQDPSTPLPPASSSPVQEDRVADVVVDGRSSRIMARDFSREVIAPPPGHGVSRWNGSVCIGVTNLSRDAALYMVDRISDVAIDSGITVQTEGCSPNIIIVWSDDGAAMASAMVERSPRSFRPHYSGSSHSRAALDRFKTSERAVRWWHVSLPVDSDTGSPAVRMPGESQAPMIRGRGLLHTPLRYDLRRAFVVIDVRLTGDATLQQITDYVAMAALSQIDPGADLRAYPTILNLFSDVAVEQSMTDWDESWLHALYRAELNQRRGMAQATSVGGLMHHENRRNRDAATATDLD